MSRSASFLMNMAAWAARALPAPLKQSLYKIPAVARLLRRSLNKAVPQGIVETEIAGGMLAGMHMVLDLHSEKDYWLGTYESDLQAAAVHFILPGMCVYDLGANIGYISLLAARLNGPAGLVIAFEALPNNIERLQRNIALNRLQQRILVKACAVTAVSGKAEFLLHPSGAMGKLQGSAGRDETYQQTLPVQGLALDDFTFTAGNPKPGLVKMDIEGGEGLALLGMPRLLVEVQPVFLIELHGEQAACQVWQQLRVHGYSLHRMQRGYAPIQSLQELDWKAYVVALPQSYKVD